MMKFKTLAIAALLALGTFGPAMASSKVFVWRPDAGQFGGHLLPANAFTTSGSTSGSGSTGSSGSGSTGSGSTGGSSGSGTTNPYVFRSYDFYDTDVAGALKVTVSLSKGDLVRYRIPVSNYFCNILAANGDTAGVLGYSNPYVFVQAGNANGYYVFKPKVTGVMALSIECFSPYVPGTQQQSYLDQMVLTVNP